MIFTKLKVAYRATHLLAFFLILVLFVGTAEEAKAQDYLKTPEEEEAYNLYYNNFRDSLLKLPDDEYNKGAALLFCDAVSKVNQSLYDVKEKDRHLLIEGNFESPDSFLYQSAFGFHSPLNYLIMDREPIIDSLLVNCPDDYRLFKWLDRDWESISLLLLWNSVPEIRNRNRKEREHKEEFTEFIEDIDKAYEKICCSDSTEHFYEYEIISAKEILVTSTKKYDERVRDFVCNSLNQVNLEALAQDMVVITEEVADSDNNPDTAMRKDFYGRDANRLNYVNGSEAALYKNWLMYEPYNTEQKAEVVKMIREKCPEQIALRIKATPNAELIRDGRW